MRGKRGTQTSLHDDLVKQGYSYNKEYGHWKDTPHRILVYSKKGAKPIRMVRVQRGQKAMWLPQPKGATSWLAKTAGTADTYELR